MEMIGEDQSSPEYEYGEDWDINTYSYCSLTAIPDEGVQSLILRLNAMKTGANQAETSHICHPKSKPEYHRCNGREWPEANFPTQTSHWG